MDTDLERTVIAGLRAGDRQAWARLYNAYAPRLWTNVHRLMGFDSAAAPDVVQETLLAAARSAGRFDPDRGSLWPWLWGIARRQIALHYRKAAPAAAFEVADGSHVAGGEGPADIVARRERAERIRAVLRRLPADYQVLLLARHVDGRSVADVAAELNCSPVAAASRLARAKKAFRKVFAKLYPTTEVSS